MKRAIIFSLVISIFYLSKSQTTDEDTLRLKEITVSAAQALIIPQFNLPGAVGRVSTDQMLTTWSRTGAEALESATGVWLQKTNHGGGSPIVRGMTGNQLLLMLDGVRLNNAIYRYGPNQYLSMVSTNWIDHIDVKRGSGSVEYGSDALGGVVNISSGSPFYSDKTQMMINMGTSLGTHYRFKNSTELSATADLIFSSPDFYVKAGYTKSNFGNLISGTPETLQIASGYREQSGNFKYAHKLNDNSTITIAWFRDVQKNVGRTDKMTDKYSEYLFDPQKLDIGYLRWNAQTSNKWVKKVEATFSYQRLEENRKMTKTASFTQNSESDLVNTLGGSLIAISEINDHWKASSGIDFYHDDVSSSAFSMDYLRAIKKSYRGLYADNSILASSSLYSNHFIQLNRLNINFGGRLNQTQIRGEDVEFGDINLKPIALVGSAGINYKLTRGWAITSQISNGFRAPNINDISSFGLFDYGFEVPSPELIPEKSLSSEIGFKVLLPKFSGTITAYQTNLYNLIVRVPGTLNGDSVYQDERVYLKTNTNQALIRGIEADWNWKPFQKLLLNGFATYSFGKDLEQGNPLRRIPPLFGQMRGQFYLTKKISVGSVVKMAGKQSRLSNGDIDDDRIPEGGTPGWICWDAFGTFNTKNFILSIHMLNISNENYRIHGSGLQQQGTGFLFKLKSNF